MSKGAKHAMSSSPTDTAHPTPRRSTVVTTCALKGALLVGIGLVVFGISATAAARSCKMGNLPLINIILRTLLFSAFGAIAGAIIGAMCGLPGHRGSTDKYAIVGKSMIVGVVTTSLLVFVCSLGVLYSTFDPIKDGDPVRIAIAIGFTGLMSVFIGYLVGIFLGGIVRCGWNDFVFGVLVVVVVALCMGLLGDSKQWN
jgi:hypothetical protein